MAIGVASSATRIFSFDKALAQLFANSFEQSLGRQDAGELADAMTLIRCVVGDVGQRAWKAIVTVLHSPRQPLQTLELVVAG